MTFNKFFEDLFNIFGIANMKYHPLFLQHPI